MPARATSSATISFGLVTIPVKVYAAVQSKAVHFNMLDPRDKARVKQQLVNANTGEPVERGSTLRGYEYARGQYVVFTDAELEALEQKSDKTIEIAEFVPIERVDPNLFEKSNLLGPDKGAAKAYRLLNEAMTLTGRVAIGRFAKPSVDQGPAGTVVRFFAWSSPGGEVAAYEVFVGGDARVAVRREATAAHVGGHVDPIAGTRAARPSRGSPGRSASGR